MKTCGTCGNAEAQRYKGGGDSGFVQCRFEPVGKWFSGRIECRYQPVRWISKA